MRYNTAGWFSTAAATSRYADPFLAVPLPRARSKHSRRRMVLILPIAIAVGILLLNAVPWLEWKRENARRAEAAFIERGAAASAIGNYDQAIAEFSEALELDPNDARAWLGRGKARLAKRDFDRALADFDEALRLDPNEATAAVGRRDVWHNKGGTR